MLLLLAALFVTGLCEAQPDRPSEAQPFLLPSSVSPFAATFPSSNRKYGVFGCLLVDRKRLRQDRPSTPSVPANRGDAQQENVKREARFAEAARVLSGLKGQCTDKAATPQSGYVYDVCIGTSVRQRGGGDNAFLLGTFQDEAQPRLRSPSLVQAFVKGDRCPSTDRKSFVRYVCGDKFEVLAASEPSVCVYHLRVAVPQLCDYKEAVSPDGDGAARSAKLAAAAARKASAASEEISSDVAAAEPDYSFSLEDEVARLLASRGSQSQEGNRKLMGLLFPGGSREQAADPNTADVAGVGGASLGRDKSTRMGERWTGLANEQEQGASSDATPTSISGSDPLGSEYREDELGPSGEHENGPGDAQGGDSDGQDEGEDGSGGIEQSTWLLEARAVPSDKDGGGSSVVQCVVYKTDDLRRQLRPSSHSHGGDLEGYVMAMLALPEPKAKGKDAVKGLGVVVEAAQLTSRTSNRRITNHDVELKGEADADTSGEDDERVGWAVAAPGSSSTKAAVSDEEQRVLLELINSASSAGKHAGFPTAISNAEVLLIAAYQQGVEDGTPHGRTAGEGIEFLTMEAMVASSR